MNTEEMRRRCLLVSDLVHVHSLTRDFRATMFSWIKQSNFYKGRLNKFIISLLVVMLVFMIGAYYVYAPLTAHYLSHTSYFTVVVDCGSTGSRVNVYKWFVNSTMNEDYPILLQSIPEHANKSSSQGNVCQYHCMQTEPGLDKFVRNASGVREALFPLLLWAEQQIPSERHKDTSLFLLATAGLRKLPTEDADWILGTVDNVVKGHPFTCRKNWIRILTGQEEAYYGWVALNYKMKRLENSLKVPTLGVLDLGGSSLQFVMETNKLREGHNIVSRKFGSVEHHILAYSLPAFGLNEAFDRTVVMLCKEVPLAKKSDGRLLLRHPCLSSRVSWNYTCHSCFHQNDSYWRSSSYQLLDSQLNLVGDPDWEQCKRLASAAAIYSSSEDLSQLIMDMNGKGNLSSSDGVTLQNLTVFPGGVAHFHALSGFFAVYNLLNLSPRANLTTLLEKGRELCSQLWSDLKEFPGNEKYAEQFCFGIPYLASLIEDALCMGNTKIIFGPGDVSWTLGAALVEGKSIRPEVQDDRFTLKSMEFLFSPAFYIILFLCLSFIVYGSQFKQTAFTSMPITKAASAVVSLSFISSKRQSNNHRLQVRETL